MIIIIIILYVFPNNNDKLRGKITKLLIAQIFNGQESMVQLIPPGKLSVKDPNGME